MSKKTKIAYLCVGAGVILLLVLGALYDLTISLTLFQPDNVAAGIMESVGTFPPYVFVAATFGAFFFLIDREKKGAVPLKVLCVFCTVAAYVVYGYTASEVYLEETVWRILVALGAALLLTPPTFLLIRNLPADTKQRLAVFLLFASIVSLSGVLVVNAIKFVWGRPRFREMIADADTEFLAFTPWYQPNGFSLHGHHSFPSGHTCAATNLLALFALNEVFDEKDSRKKVIWFVVGLYIFIMAYARIVIGAHFLSDVTFGFLIGFLTYTIGRYLYFDKSKRVIAWIMKINRAKEESEREEEESLVPEIVKREEIEISLESTTDDGAEITFSKKVIEEEKDED